MSRNCAKCSHNHADKHYCTFSEHGEPCLCNQSTPDTVTITISREAAEAFANLDNACTWDGCTAAECVIERALRAALEEER